MSANPRLSSLVPTILIQRDGRQIVRVTIANAGPATDAVLGAEGPGIRAERPVAVPTGDSTHDLLLPEPTHRTEIAFSLRVGEQIVDRQPLTWAPPPHLRVHVVQHSHHDVGYTNLPSSVRRETCRFLDETIEMAAATAAYPEAARFRLVIEQAWSLQEFVRTASPARVERMGELLRRGDMELTALFGNMTTEICGPEELIRALYPSARLARRFGCAITTAEHNDVPGISWGLAEVLAGAGIRFFAPQLPRYWSWCQPPLQGFWDDRVLFPQGQPGGFWWAAPSGRRVLLWDPWGAGGDIRTDLPGLADRLQALVGQGYPYSAVYWPVRGGARDNSPYLAGFCDTVRDWNERWAWPRLMVSTNAAFHRDLEPQLPADLPVFGGELPGQDYPVGSMSTAAATAVNRNNHVQLLVAERLATLAAQATDHAIPSETLDEAYQDALWFDEHTWGHHFPAGPAADASSVEKQTHAYRAAALAHDVTTQALARVADHIALPGDGLFLVVFNPLPQERTALVVTPMRELENCGSTMTRVTDPDEPESPGYLRGVALTDRWHLHPPAEIVAGQFDLVDVATGASVDFEISDLEADSPVPHAPQRAGLAQGGKRYGGFEVPSGIGRDLHFVAEELPACGYRTYELRPLPAAAPGANATRRAGTVIENEFYRVEAEADTGRLISVIDRAADCELLDPQAPHGLGELVVRDPEGLLAPPTLTAAPRVEAGAVRQSLDLWAAAPGHPQVRLRVALTRGLKRLDLALRVLKEPTPLLDAHVAFPFALSEPCFRFESALSLQTPPECFLPGAYWDELAVQNWVRVSGGGHSVLWTARDTPMATLGCLTPGYTSPAHSCRVPQRIHHPPAGPEQLERAWLYSLVCAGNFGTNFAVSQTGSLLCRYSLTTRRGEMSDADAVRLGWETVMPPETIFTDRRRPGHLPLQCSLLSCSGDPVVLLACKPADDGEGLIVRLWNPTAATAAVTVRMSGSTWTEARLVALNEDEGSSGGNAVGLLEADAFGARLAAGALATVRLT